MSRVASLFLTAMAAAVVPIGPALACSVAVPADYEGSAKEARDVQTAIERSTAIVDGEVVRPFIEGRQNAVVQVHHVLKGAVPTTIEVGAADSCAIRLDTIGERARMVLSGGPDVFQLYRDQSEARLEDRILKSDRRKVWPYYRGQLSSAE